MKIKNLLSLLALTLVLFSCGSDTITEGTLIKGQLANAKNLKIYLDRVGLGTPNDVLANTEIGADGSFALGFEKQLAPGTYQLRAGAQKAVIALGPDDHMVKIDGDVSTFGKYDFTVSGSKDAEEMVSSMKSLRQNAVKVEDIQNVVTSVSNPEIGAFIAYNSLARAGAQGLPVHEEVMKRLPETSPNKATYNRFVQGIKAQAAQQRASETIQVGMPAPDIRMKSPEGKEYALSDLKGQVVLLDFWASWCGPCRRENPNVVKVYNKYKDDGFTIFSVSLDGLDSRRTAGMNAEQIQRGQEAQKQRWVAAIQKDNLTWPYHVSELTKWESTAGRAYGVRGIPKTFMIDRDGNIAAVGLRGAASIEQALQQII